MASSRSSSPASGRGASPEPLTPRSKIKALLAAVDSSEDEGTRPQGQEKPKARSAPDHLARSPTRTGLNMPDTHNDTSEEDDSDVQVRPRGRLAARMHAAAQPVQGNTSTTSITEADWHAAEQTGSLPDDDVPQQSDDNDLPVAPRRLKRKAPQADTETAPRSPSPGLFVSSPVRPSPAKTVEHGSGSEEGLPAVKSDRFKALVERKRQERLAREAAEEARKAERRAEQEKMASELEQLASDEGNVSDITDDEAGRKLTQDARPTRKASKRAIEEMSRETQRMARNMQLAHEAKTRKKISKHSLFERFNYRPAGETAPPATSSSRPATPPTDAEMKDAETPPSSPPMAPKDLSKETVEGTETTAEIVDNDDSPSVETLLTTKIDKGKGKEVLPQVSDKPALQPKRQVRVKFPQPMVNHVTIDSDDELEITNTSKGKLHAVFDNVPSKRCQESHSIQALRALAQLKSPGKKAGRKREQPGMTKGELQTYLQQKARQQAKVAREQRLQVLKAQGVVVQTAEERERQMQEVEDIVAKAREEAEQIMAQEKAEAKQNKDGQNDDPLSWDESDDEEYQASADEDEEAADVELSGSEDEDNEGDEEDEEAEAGNPMFDDAADDASDKSVESAPEDVDMVEDEDISTPRVARRARKHTTILSDDEAEVEATPQPKSASQRTPKIASTTTPGAPSSVLRSATKNFIPGLPVQGPAGLGLTQIFAGTMDDSQMTPGQGPTQSMMPDFDQFPDSNLSATMEEYSNTLAPDTQREETQATTQGVHLNFSQSQMRGLDSLVRDIPNTQMSEIIEASQDGGLQDYTPLKERFVDAPNSTVDTVLIDPEDAPHDSPLVRRGRLRRKIVSETNDELVPTAIGDAPTQPTAFNLLKEGAVKEKKMKLVEEFNRKKSKAKEMVQEQAEESEDEYQGLGGVDGEDSDDESVASVKDMIDDATGNNVDERKLAAFYADRERIDDEQQVQKLFKDITTGMLRRKRGADYDLSDSDDGGEARRRRKRQQFAKMQKALFADERVKKIAENPGNQAFLRSIEDRGSDDDMDFLDATEDLVREDSQSQSQPEQNEGQVVPDSQPRPALGAAAENRAPAHMRRTKGGRRPANIGEVRETLSNLLDDGREMSVIPATEVGSDSEREDGEEEEEGEEGETSSVRSDKENHAPNPRRGRQMIVDRITLKRNSSSTSSAGVNSRLAFAAQTSSTFKVPALLRRATTNSFKSGSSSSGSAGGATSTTGDGGSAGGFGEDAKIKKAASKRSGINAFARENERRAKLAENERRRQEKKVRGAEKRIGVVGGLLGKGSFE